MSTLPPLSAAQLALLLTGLLLMILLGLGLRLQLGRPHGARWLHHVLFFVVTAGVGVTGMLGWREGKPGWLLLPAFISLLSMPATRPGMSAHWQRALLCTGLFLTGGFLIW